jgi:succinoglycan biosynthesis protein ExoL
MKNFLFLLPVLGQPRFNKRINSLTSLGASSKALYFDREYFSGKAPGCGVTSLGDVKQGSYISRIFVYLSSLYKIRRSVREEDVVYTFGLDMLLLAFIALLGKKNKLILEVGDIRPIQLSGSLLGRLIRSIDRYLIGKTDCLVVTSEAFIDNYYVSVLGERPKKYMVIENKLDKQDFTSLESFANEESYTIGYFGLLRCKESMRILEDYAYLKSANNSVYLRGYPMGTEQEFDSLRAISGVKYGGEFVSPDDLKTLYSSVSMVWACYPFGSTSIGNWKWAKTNRFYESCAFGVPLITQKGTMDAKMVDKYCIGMSLDMSDPASCVKSLLSVTVEELNQWKENLNRLDDSVCFYKDEHSQLAELIG